MKIGVIDNYDSFTLNLTYLLKQEGISFEIYRNDKISAQQAAEFDGLLLSPGPGLPEEAGNLMSIIQSCFQKIPILGVCLGHQAIAAHFESGLSNLKKVSHGIEKSVLLTERKSRLFSGISNKFQAGHYHSWIVDQYHLSPKLEVTAIDENREIMALEHHELPIYGVQFHPESIMTAEGPRIIKNFIGICKEHIK
ncbi:MAG: aminodeoxychorismate/anthranilate synthase component II [Flavobacteriales bacterium]|nr:aminodeoxychorismate/anthranilate synthase component II [Flavobacteriales bacterium]